MKYKLAGALLGLLIVALIWIVLATGLSFIGMPSRSDEFDCDDATKFVYDRLSGWGISPTIMLGNLKKTGYSYSENDHIWLLVTLGPLTIPFDWEKATFGKKYYEGYPISYDKLLYFVEQDFAKRDESVLPAKKN